MVLLRGSTLKGPPMRLTKRITMLLASLMLSIIASGSSYHAVRVLPNPILYLTGTEPYTAGGKAFTRYKYDVLNKDDYPADLFAAAPALPPCGANTKASRTWVDFYDSRGKRLYGFCALAKPADLSTIWFALEQ